MRQVGGDTRAGSAKGVAQGDGATAHVRLVIVKAELLLDGQELRRKGLVDFAQIHLVQVQVGSFKSLLDGWHRPNAHDLRVAPGRGVRDDTGQWRQIVLFNSVGTGQNQRHGAIANARGVAGVDGAALLENGAQLGHHFDRRLGLWMLVDFELDNFTTLN